MKNYSIIEKEKPITGELESITVMSATSGSMSFDEMEKELIRNGVLKNVRSEDFPLFDGHVFEYPKYSDSGKTTYVYCSLPPFRMNAEFKKNSRVTLNALTVNNN